MSRDPNFDNRLRDFKLTSPDVAEARLPDGVREASDGEFEARCCCCSQWKPIYCDLQDIPDEGYKHYCGGSPWCCP